MTIKKSLVAQTVKNPAKQETWVQSLGWEDPLEWGNPLQYSCLENPHGQRSLAGYSPWGRKESDTTEQLRTARGMKRTIRGFFFFSKLTKRLRESAMTPRPFT